MKKEVKECNKDLTPLQNYVELEIVWTMTRQILFTELKLYSVGSAVCG